MRQFKKAAIATACMVAAMSYVGMSPAFAATQGHGTHSSGNGTSTLTGNTDTNLLSQSTNQGPADPGKQMDISIILKTHNNDNGQSLANFIQATETPTNAQYHQFLSASQFKSDFAPTDSQVTMVKKFLEQQGLTVTNTYSNNLVIQATGSIGAVEKTFNVTINQYQHGNKTFFANSADPQVPSTVSGLILGITGMTTFSDMKTNSMSKSSYITPSSAITLDKSGAPTEAPGQYGPAKVRSFYNINPLYKSATGKGETIGIATLANFNPSDAYVYWKDYGVSTAKNRITVTPVNGGFPSGVHQPGAGETTLDVEQSGSMAPGANIDVYEAPNTNPGFIDLFYKVASDDSVSVMSTSWGEWEGYETPDYHLMMNQAFEEGAAEGISMFAAAGDSGAYDEYYNQNKLAVDSPASDPYITAAGGTAYPAKLGFYTIPQERVWGWDYIVNNYQAFDSVFGVNWSYGKIKSYFYPVGGGGGVSSSWAMPWYQQNVPGMNGTGRNVPDISLNADPFTGYSEYDTFGPGNTGWEIGWGGTSFVAPQLAGITALMDSATGTRLGFLNPMLYQLATSSNAYGTSTSPFNDITAGDNWYYDGVKGYDDGSGIGSLNVTNLEKAIANLK